VKNTLTPDRVPPLFHAWRVKHLHDAHIKQLESLLLRIAKPSGNRVSGNFAKSANMYRPLHRAMSNQLRLRADAFHRRLQDEIQTVRALIHEQRVRQAKRRGYGRRMD
jgi:DNA polymerase/3'-5' exonuclease PolX